MDKKVLQLDESKIIEREYKYSLSCPVITIDDDVGTRISFMRNNKKYYSKKFNFKMREVFTDSKNLIIVTETGINVLDLFTFRTISKRVLKNELYFWNYGGAGFFILPSGKVLGINQERSMISEISYEPPENINFLILTHESALYIIDAGTKSLKFLYELKYSETKSAGRFIPYGDKIIYKKRDTTTLVIMKITRDKTETLNRMKEIVIRDDKEDLQDSFSYFPLPNGRIRIIIIYKDSTYKIFEIDDTHKVIEIDEGKYDETKRNFIHIDEDMNVYYEIDGKLGFYPYSPETKNKFVPLFDLHSLDIKETEEPSEIKILRNGNILIENEEYVYILDRKGKIKREIYGGTEGGDTQEYKENLLIPTSEMGHYEFMSSNGQKSTKRLVFPAYARVYFVEIDKSKKWKTYINCVLSLELNVSFDLIGVIGKYI